METNAKEIGILPNSSIGPCSLTIFSLIEPYFIRGGFAPQLTYSIADGNSGDLGSAASRPFEGRTPQTLGFSLYHDCRVHAAVQDTFCAPAYAKFLPKLLLFSSSYSYSFTVSCSLTCFSLCGRQAPFAAWWLPGDKSYWLLILCFEVHTILLIKT